MKIKVGDFMSYLFDDTSYWIGKFLKESEYYDNKWDGDIKDYPTKTSALRSEIIKEIFLTELDK